MPILGGVTQTEPRMDKPQHYRKDLSSPVKVHFEGGGTAHLDRKHPHFLAFVKVLRDVPRTLLRVEAEVDHKGSITELRLPLTTTVESMKVLPSRDVEVKLSDSACRHVVRMANPEFRELVRVLERAQENQTPLLVTEADPEHEIIAAKPAPGILGQGERRFSPPRASAAEAAPVTGQRARHLFALLTGSTCDVSLGGRFDATLAHAPCIPFLYPDNGCWARAHAMCRLLLEQAAEPAKLWVYGSLDVSTDNSPRHEVRWFFHVVPVLRVDAGTGLETWVLDPSLFDAPVPQDEFLERLRCRDLTTARTGADVYVRETTGKILTDPTYSRTAQSLAQWRHSLILRSSKIGPPPYPEARTAAAGR